MYVPIELERDVVVRTVFAAVVGLTWCSSGHVGTGIGGSRGIARSKLRLALDLGQDLGPGLAVRRS